MKLSISLLSKPLIAAGLFIACSSIGKADNVRGNRITPPRPLNAIRAVNYNQCTTGNCNPGPMNAGAGMGNAAAGQVGYGYSGGPYGPGTGGAYGGNGNGWFRGGGWGNGACPNGNCHSGHCHGGNCPGGCLFGCGCLHDIVQGKAFIRPPAVWGIPQMSGTYPYYWNPVLTGGTAFGGGAYPMVYQPTDTTQLGFSYQHVPRWHYRPEMLPPPPVPNWPLGMNSAYPHNWNYAGYGDVVYPSTSDVQPGTAVDHQAEPNSVQPPAPGGQDAVPSAPESGVVVPEPEAAVFPQRVRR